MVKTAVPMPLYLGALSQRHKSAEQNSNPKMPPTISLSSQLTVISN